MEKSRKEIKAYLLEYLVLLREEELTQREINRLRSRLDLKSPAITGMPRPAKSYTTEDFIADAEDLFTYLEDLKDDQVRSYTKIRKSIAAVDNPTYRELLTLRYLLGLDLRAVAAEMGYSYSRIRQLHGNALEAVKS